jgi:hypothetical protein
MDTTSLRFASNYNNSVMISATLIAPCGMNCGLCRGYLRKDATCDGCRSSNPNKPTYCYKCIIKNCSEFKSGRKKYCYECNAFPCRRLKQLDKRYRLKYHMSMIENLGFIQTHGIRAFVRKEKTRWACPRCGSVLCVHLEECMVCGKALSGLS